LSSCKRFRTHEKEQRAKILPRENAKILTWNQTIAEGLKKKFTKHKVVFHPLYKLHILGQM
jgi:hypothetical protein